MQHVRRLEAEIHDYIETTGVHQDTLRLLRTFYSRKHRAPNTADIEQMTESLRVRILADALEHGDMDNEDRAMDISDSDVLADTVNLADERRKKFEDAISHGHVHTDDEGMYSLDDDSQIGKDDLDE